MFDSLITSSHRCFADEMKKKIDIELCFLINNVSVDPFSNFENCLMSQTFQNMAIILISSF